MGALGLKQAAIQLLKRNVKLKKGEKVVVVSDRKSCPIFNAICSAVKMMGGNLLKVKITRKRYQKERKLSEKLKKEILKIHLVVELLIQE
jgi:leucyl aminopeptidase (aminopeptidase T)